MSLVMLISIELMKAAGNFDLFMTVSVHPDGNMVANPEKWK